MLEREALRLQSVIHVSTSCVGSHFLQRITFTYFLLLLYMNITTTTTHPQIQEKEEENISKKMETTTPPLKIYMLPFFAQGHMIPLVNLARLLSSQHQQVTIITTPSNAQLLDKTVDDERSLGHYLSIHIVKFPAKQLNLPDGIENLSAASDNATAGKIHMAAHLIKPEIESFIEQNPPDVFINDIMFTWSDSTAKCFQIPRLVFNPISIFDICLIDAIKKNPEAFATDSGPYHIPGLPHSLTLPIKPSTGFARLTESLLEAENGSHGVIVNSFTELYIGYTEYYESLTGRKVWHVGPTSLMVQKSSIENDVLSTSLKHEALTWLDTKEACSVVYICFGSMCRLSDEQLYQIGIGLDSSNHNFLWVVHREKSGKENLDGEEEQWLPKGFEDKIKRENKGMIINGWAPQPLILNHASIGGFFTHCGTNSVIEAISSGIPMITLPCFGDQYYIERLVTEVHGIGVEVGATEWSLSPYDAKKQVVSRDRIEKAVKSLMSDNGKETRKRAKEIQEKAWKAVKKDGSSQQCLTQLIDYLKSVVVVPKYSKQLVTCNEKNQ